MHDAHYHYSKEINALQNEYGISGICNVANEKEFELVHQKQLFYSCGVHPWNASLDVFESMLPLLKRHLSLAKSAWIVYGVIWI